MVRYTVACGKRRYNTLYAANVALEAIWRYALRSNSNRSETLPCRSYPCERCKGYHHTSKPVGYWREVTHERGERT